MIMMKRMILVFILSRRSPSTSTICSSVHCRLLRPSAGYRDQLAYQKTIDEYFITKLVDQTITWRSIDVPKDRYLCKLELKYLIRKGIPDAYRGTVS